jgi:hypothetical protein
MLRRTVNEPTAAEIRPAIFLKQLRPASEPDPRFKITNDGLPRRKRTGFVKHTAGRNSHFMHS